MIGAPPMRVMFVLPELLPGGAERQTVDLANGLRRFGHHTCIVLLRSRLEGTIAFEPLRFCDASGYLDAAAIGRLRDEICGYAPHVVVAVNPYALMYVHLAIRRGPPGARGAPAIAAAMHSTRPLSLKERLQNLVYRRFVRASDLLIYVCRFQADYWARRGLRAGRSVVIYNGVDVESFRPADPGERAAMRAKLGVSEADLLIGITAGFRPEKNHEFLLAALRALRARGQAVKLLMIGDGPRRARMQQLAFELGVGEHAIFAGAQADVRPLVATFDLMVLASTTEAFSMAVLEAMGMGIPAVLSDVGGARELVETGRSGYVYALNDMAGFLEAIGHLGDAGVRRAFGAAARARVEQNFKRESMLAGYDQQLGLVAGAGAADERLPAPVGT